MAPDTEFIAAVAARYRVERELGRGGMATVYLAEDLRHHRPVAVKVLPPSDTFTAADRFLREIRITSQLTHPHILTLHDSGEAAGRPFYVMPFVAGESLRQRLRRETRLAIDETLRLGRELSGALQYAHRRGIVHRDIKPENILLHEGHAMLADFGIAAALSDAGSASTQTGGVTGTLGYMSPEQLAGGTCDGRTDVYALGCVLFECLTGQPLHGTESAANPLGRFDRTSLPSVRSIRPEVQPAVDHAIRMALEPDPQRRLSSAEALAAALAGTAPATAADRPAIVVLPFANLSPELENEYFSDGLTEEISADLARVRSLRVISRTSAMRFKGTTKDLGTIARELGVAYLLEGSVRTAGASLRITAQLVDAAADSQLWAEKFSGTVEDVFDVQERVAREIVKALRVTLSTDEERSLAGRPISDPRAFDLFLRARQEIRRYGDGPERAQALIDEAIAIEGPTPPLGILKGWAQVAQVKSGVNRDFDVLAEAEAEARRVLAASPSFSQAHSLLAYVHFERGRLADAVRHFGVALAGEPTDADALLYLGLSYFYAGHTEAARAVSDRLLACDPLGSFTWVLRGCARWLVGDFASAPAILAKSIELDEQNFMGHWATGYACAAAGDLATAERQAAWLWRVGPHVPYTTQLLAIVESLRGDREAARARLAALNTAPFDQHLTFHVSESWAVAGDHERALALLMTAVEKGFYPAEYISRHCPFFEAMRDTPRFRGIVAEAERRHALFAGEAPPWKGSGPL
jgi:serine/threonine protein kinase/Flp pilus assembly protein TadD